MSYTDYYYGFRRDRISEPSQLHVASDLFHPTIDQRYMLGCIFDANDGRRWRYCENSGTAILYKALMAQSAVPIAGWTEQVQTTGTAAAVGDHIITVYIGTTCIANDFRDGWLSIVDVTTAALGDMYLIKSNTAGTLPAVTLSDAGGIRTATATDTDITLAKNKYKDCVVVPKVAATAACVGVPLVDVPVNYFFWAQTKGPCPVIVDTDDVIPGDQVGETDDANIDGACGTHAVTYPIWGTVMSENTAGQTDQPCIIDLNLE